MHVFEVHNAKKCLFLVWRAKRAYLCTRSAIKSVFGCRVWVCFKYTMPKDVCCWYGAPNLHSLLRKCGAKPFWIPSMGVFEMQNAKKCVLSVWCARRAYLCTNIANKTVLRHLGGAAALRAPWLDTLGTALGPQGPWAIGAIHQEESRTAVGQVGDDKWVRIFLPQVPDLGGLNLHLSVKP